MIRGRVTDETTKQKEQLSSTDSQTQSTNTTHVVIRYIWNTAPFKRKFGLLTSVRLSCSAGIPSERNPTYLERV